MPRHVSHAPACAPATAGRATRDAPEPVNDRGYPLARFVALPAVRRWRRSERVAVGGLAQRDAVLVAGGLGGDVAVEHVVEHGLGVAAARVAVAAAAGRVQAHARAGGSGRSL